MNVQERERERERESERERVQCEPVGFIWLYRISENWIVLVLVMIYAATANIRASNAVDQTSVSKQCNVHHVRARSACRKEREDTKQNKEPLYFISF